MADIAVTAAQVGRIFPEKDEVHTVILEESVTAGQVLYQTTTGTYGLADADVNARQQARGIALAGGGAGQTVPLLKRGFVEGFAVSGLNADARLYLSDTAGALNDVASSTLSVTCGRVFVVNGKKVVYADFDWLRQWA